MNNDALKQWLLDRLSSDIVATLIAGFFGALLAVAHQKEITFWEALIQIVSGVAVAYYGVVLVENFITIKPKAAAGIGFVLGLTGMYLIGGVLKLAKGFRENPSKILERWKIGQK